MADAPMDSITSATVATIIVVGGRWAESKPIDIKQAVGLMIAVLLLTVANNVDEKLGSKLGLVMLITAMFYKPSDQKDPPIVAIVKKLGFWKAAG